jgi:hypothetical protein
MNRTMNRLLLPGLLLMVGAAACNKDMAQNPPPDDPAGTTVPEDAVPDFSLTDVNSTSPTYNTGVSPRDEVGKVSAWYFGHAT